MTRAASAASAHPAVESWSVIARTSTPALAALATRPAGVSVPSEAVECAWRSISTPGA